MTDEHKQYASTAVATLEAHILSVHSAKSEAEWWAHKEILNLREELEKTKRFYIEAGFELRQLREDNKRLRAALKPFAECNPIERDDTWFAHEVRIEDFRAAAAALKETGE